MPIGTHSINGGHHHRHDHHDRDHRGSHGQGNDTITVKGSGTVYVTGSSGHDTITLGHGSDTVIEQGSATVYGSFGSAVVDHGQLSIVEKPHGESVTAGSGNATLVGGKSNVTFTGGTGSTSMVGGSGNDTFVGGSGHDTMTGGTGHNVFSFSESAQGGTHVISNFTAGEDKISLHGYNLNYVLGHDVTYSGGNAYIKLDGGKTTIEVKGVTHLTKSDFS